MVQLHICALVDNVHVLLCMCPEFSAGVPGRPFDASDLGRLPLLSAVIKETLRVCAPAPFGGTRWVVQEEGVDMCGYNVPKVCSEACCS